jgi:alcohol dehydrogenase class IV
MLVPMVGIGLHHAICHVLGGHFGVPHGESNSVMLAHVVAFNAPAMPDVACDIAQALGAADAAAGIASLAARIGAPASLRELGLPKASLAAVAREVAAKRIPNPRPVTAEAVEALLSGAWEGQLPAPQSTPTPRNRIQGGKHHAGSTAH